MNELKLKKMATISNITLCKQENISTFFDKIKNGEAIHKTIPGENNEPKKIKFVDEKGRIFLSGDFNVEFYHYDGELRMKLSIMSLEDKKAIKDFKKGSDKKTSSEDL